MTDILLKKKECIQMLLKEDIELYNHLFEGNVTYFEGEKNYHFKLLVYKFQNFAPFLIAWYKSDKIKYLKELWTEYICIEDLRNLGSKEKVEKYMTERTSYKDWPKTIKKEFNLNIKADIKTEVQKLKNGFEKLTKYEKDLYIKLENLIKTYGSEYPGTGKVFERYKYELLKVHIPSLSISLFEKYQKILLDDPSKSQNGTTSNIIFDLKQFISNNPKVTKTVIQVMEGVIGLGQCLYGINEYYTISKEVEKFEEFKDKLKKIKKDFDDNKEAI